MSQVSAGGEGLPSNLISEAKVLGAVIRKTRDGKKLTVAEAKVVERYRAIEEEEAAKTYVKNQIDLANKLGCVRETISRHMKKAGNPGRSSKGYCVEEWKEYLAPELESLAGYQTKPDASDANSAEIHQTMLRKSRELHLKLELAEKKGDKAAIAFFEKRWLDVSKQAKDFENLIQRHELEIGETITVAEMERVEFFVILVMLDASNRFLDEFAVTAEACSGSREIRSKAESVFEEMVKAQFRKAVTAKKLDPRVLSLWERAMTTGEEPKKKAAKKVARKKK